MNLRQVADEEVAPFLNTYELLRGRTSGTDVAKYYWVDEAGHFKFEGNRMWAGIQLECLLDERNDLLPVNRLMQVATTS